MLTPRLCLIAALFIAVAVNASAGDFSLEKTGDLYTLTATDTPLSDILAEIDRREPASLRLYGDTDKHVTVTYRRQSLDQLLYRLGISYILVYEADQDGQYQLGDAVVIDSDADGLDPATRERVRKLIKDLQSDDISYNAHIAIHNLDEIGCPAVPLLEQALYGDDYQGVQLAARALRSICPEAVPSDKLLEVTLSLLKREGYDDSQYWSLFSAGDAYWYILNTTGVYERVRSNLIGNLQSRDRQERLLSALLVAEQGESGLAGTLVPILVPHLKDNDMKSDGAAATHALYQLGPAALPYLAPYRTSPDVQQAEMSELICTALETGTVPSFDPVMYAGYNKNPLIETAWVQPSGWSDDRFPDEQGNYHNLGKQRWTRADYYGGKTYLYEREPEPLLVVEPDAVNYTLLPLELDPNKPDDPFPYRVRPDETAEEIGIKFSVPLEKLQQFNPGLPNGRIPAGSIIRIPWY